MNLTGSADRRIGLVRDPSVICMFLVVVPTFGRGAACRVAWCLMFYRTDTTFSSAVEGLLGNLPGIS